MEGSQGLVVGVDTHKDTHSAALVDELGGVVRRPTWLRRNAATFNCSSGRVVTVHTGPGSSKVLVAMALG
jgi:hypothetical protein